MSVRRSPAKAKHSQAKTTTSPGANGNILSHKSLLPSLIDADDNHDISFSSCMSPTDLETRDATKSSGNLKLSIPENSKIEINRRMTRRTCSSLNSLNLLDAVSTKKRKNVDMCSSLDSVADEFSTLFASLQASYNQIDNLTAVVDKLVCDNIQIKKSLDDLVLTNRQLVSDVAQLKSMLPHKGVQTYSSVAGGSSENSSGTAVVPIVEPFPALQAPRKPENIVVIKPKDTKQQSKMTMSEIRKKISPSKKQIIKVRNATNGGVIIECATKEAISDLKTDAASKLGELYNVTIPEKRLPKVRVFGISEEMASDDIKTRLLEQNFNIFRPESVINIYSVNKAINSERYWFKLECDPQTFSAVINEGRLRIGWDICTTREMVDIRRCFQCQSFGHSSKTCTINPKCPKCSGDHEIDDCKSEVSKCVNCDSSNRELNMNLPTDHFAWSIDCSVYKRHVDRQRKFIDYGMK